MICGSERIECRGDSVYPRVSLCEDNLDSGGSGLVGKTNRAKYNSIKSLCAPPLSYFAP